MRRAVPLLSPSNDVIAGDLQQCRVSLQLVGQDPPVTGRRTCLINLGGHGASMSESVGKCKFGQVWLLVTGSLIHGAFRKLSCRLTLARQGVHPDAVPVRKSSTNSPRRMVGP